MASGVLTGKYSGKKAPEGSRLTIAAYDFLTKSKFEGEDAWQIDAADQLKPIAAELGCSLAQLSIAWCLKNPFVSCVLLGATTMAQLEENLSAVEVVPKLTADVMQRIADAAGSAAVPKNGKVEGQVAFVRQADAILGPHISGSSYYKPF